MTTSNPFSDVYDALWDLAEASDLLTSLVKPKNRVKFNQTRTGGTIKDQVSEADLPELVLVASGSSCNLHDTSSSSRITRNYEWIISTGDLRINNKLLPVEWAIFCAMLDWPTVLASLQWQGAGFIKRTAVTDISTGQSDAERNRGIAGWSSIWGIEVEMHFQTSLLRQVNTLGTGT